MNNTYIIAEAGVNHNGDIGRAKEMIAAAAKAGADAVKFQSFRTEALVTQSAQQAAYQARNIGHKSPDEQSQFAMLKALELSEADHTTLIDCCKQHGIAFLSSPFDRESVTFLGGVKALSHIKIPSGEITHAPYLYDIGRQGKPAILSTGMAVLEEVYQALAVLAWGYHHTTPPETLEACLHWYTDAGQAAKLLQGKVTLLHCTTDYPAAFDTINLKAMDTLALTFGLPVGLSDHSAGIAVPIAATARGAVMIEKHFTLSRDLPGPDHKASLEPDELAAMVSGIRAVEAALGTGDKQPFAAELSTRPIARKMLLAARPIAKGETLTADAITCKRTGKEGTSPMRYWDMLGTPATRNYQPDELLEE